MKQTIKNLNTIANMLGFGKGLLSYDKMYKTVINTFGRKDASMWFFTIALNTDNNCVGIEVNSTYFKPTAQTIAIKNAATFDTPQPLDKIIELLKGGKND
jgi:hypothetical protein